MRPDLQGQGAAGSRPPRLTRRALEGGPIALMPRDLDRAIAEALDEMSPDALPEFRLECEANAFGSLAPSAIAGGPVMAGWLVEWLINDIGFLAGVFSDLIGAAGLVIRLDTVRDDACRLFHADNVGFRLVTTYRGPGTQWVDPSFDARRSDAPLEAIRQMERGWVAITRGTRAATQNTPPLFHRSPPIRGSGKVRLFLAIDDAQDGTRAG